MTIKEAKQIDRYFDEKRNPSEEEVLVFSRR